MFGRGDRVHNGGYYIKTILSVLLVMLFSGQIMAATPQRIISAMPSITEMLFALELDNQIVGVTTNCNYPEAAGKKEKIGAMQVNLEKVAALKPDLVVMLEETQDKDIEKVTRFGLPVHSLSLKSVDDVMTAIIELGVVTDKKQKAREIVRDINQRLRQVAVRTKNMKPGIGDVLKLWQAKEEKREVLVIVGLKPLIVAGGGTFIDDVLQKAGVDNVAAKAKAAYPQYSFEKLVRQNPQYIIIPQQLVSKEELQKSKRWQSLEAVRKDRVLSIDEDILSRPGPRVIEAVEQIADFVY
ncbi:MAG: helical backbone metal receptor [bacterium]